MGAPFYAEYARMFNEPNAFDDITSQFLFIDKHTRDSSTGLLFHAWDESKQQKWANPETGVSPCFWGRAMGWYMWAIVDVLDYLPLDHPKRAELIEILQRESAALLKYREPHSGLWYQVLDQGNRAGNYLESSASCMFVYAFAKGANKGYLDISYGTVAQKSFKGILDSMLTVDEKGLIFLHHTCQGAGLGGIPYRDGSYEYYIHEKQRTNDFKAIGPFILAALELEKKYKPLENKLVPIQTENSVGEGKVVGLDYFFNNEWRLNKDSVLERWHYTWEDTTNSGFSILGRSIDLLGAHLDALQSIPTDLSLRRLSIYIIVDPDTPLETKNPNYISKEAINAIIPWVEKGGVLVLMGNDKGNSEFENFNKLAEHFGIHFNEDCYHKVLGRNFETGKSDHLPAHPIFKNVKQIFMKEICSLRIEKPAEPILTENNLVFMASARVGKGMVFAVGDPWFYNEYMDTRRLPIDYENSTAGRNLFQWLLSNADSSVH
jgi:unsaturated rhamnogalacturonyl hydrolase